MDLNKISTVMVVFAAILNNGETTENSTKATYDPGELLTKIFNANMPSARQADYVLIKFEGQSNLQDQEQGQYGLVTFDGQSNRPLKFEDQQENSGEAPVFNYNSEDLGTSMSDNGQVTFQNDNRIEGNPGQKKRKRRRRRKPRVQRPGYPANYNGQRPGFPPQGPIGNVPGFPGPQGQIPIVPGYPGQQFYRPPRRRPSLASDALTAVTGALTSIALYDDYQCVPRLLCEAAGGGALGTGSGILQSVAGIQPLLTLLSAYNGISTSPLFVFGRAVFLGMTSKSNPGTCRYAYPLCPTDPEQLVHYLNNHNGGFFRFFSAPQLPNQGQQNLEQFYNQLSVPGQYGLQSNVQNYQNNGPGQYGLYSNNIADQQTNYGFQRPGLYNGAQQLQQGYGLNYPYSQNQYGPVRFKNNNEDKGVKRNKIQKRIQNVKKDSLLDDNFDNIVQNPKWMFPETLSNNNFIPHNNNYASEDTKVDKALKFPEGNTQSSTNAQIPYRRPRGFNFPGLQSNRQYIEYHDNPSLTPVFNDNEFQFDNNGYTTADHQRTYDDDDDVIVYYVVKGNGDPNNPEIVKVKRGQTVQ